MAQTATKLTAGMKSVGRTAVRTGARAIRSFADRAAVAGSDALEAGISRRPPIQVGIDVAVPIKVVWKERMASASLPEGVHRAEDVERERAPFDWLAVTQARRSEMREEWPDG